MKERKRPPWLRWLMLIVALGLCWAIWDYMELYARLEEQAIFSPAPGRGVPVSAGPDLGRAAALPAHGREQDAVLAAPFIGAGGRRGHVLAEIQ